MIFKLFQKYSDNSTCHGIKYIGRGNFLFFERVFWFFATFLFIGLAGTVALVLWEKFSSKPILISIEKTNYPLAEIPFPEVTICPINRIDVKIALSYLSKYINTSDKSKYPAMKHVLAALYLLKYPTYNQMKKHLKLSRKFLKNFDSLNTTDFMLSVLPSCNEILRECLWHGRMINCCEIFTLQKTEEGFCYSFNSFTLEDKKLCSISSMYEEINNKDGLKKSCLPKFLTFSGIHSGLTLFFEPQRNDYKYFLPHSKPISGITVLMSPAYAFPLAGDSIILRTILGESLEIEVSPSVLRSTQKLSRIAKEERECMLDFESDLYTKYYSQQSCFITCRQDFIIRMCGCQLYFFYESEISSVPLCKVSQLICIVKYADALKLNSPSKYAFDKPFIKDFPDCNCLPACESTWFDLVIKRKNITQLMGRNVTGQLGIFYSKYGAIKYDRKLAFSIENLIVSLGGVGNLFIGASFISVSEVLYYFSRSICVIIYFRIMKSAEAANSGLFVRPTEFIN